MKCLLFHISKGFSNLVSVSLLRICVSTHKFPRLNNRSTGALEGNEMLYFKNNFLTVDTDIKLLNVVGEMVGLFNSVHCRFAPGVPLSSSALSLDRFSLLAPL